MKSKILKISALLLFSAALVPFAVAQDTAPPVTPTPPKQCRMDCKATEKAKLDTCLATAKAIPKGKQSGRKAAIKKCMQDFKQALKACRQGCKKPCDPAPCLETCASAQSDAVASCNSTFDPGACGGDPGCEADANTGRANCVADATSVFANCTSLCTCN